MPAPTTSTPRRERRKPARPQELLAAALDLLVERGYAATRLEDIGAGAARVSRQRDRSVAARLAERAPRGQALIGGIITPVPSMPAAAFDKMPHLFKFPLLLSHSNEH